MGRMKITADIIKLHKAYHGRLRDQFIKNAVSNLNRLTSNAAFLSKIAKNVVEPVLQKNHQLKIHHSEGRHQLKLDSRKITLHGSLFSVGSRICRLLISWFHHVLIPPYIKEA
jgi:hypothetical protein